MDVVALGLAKADAARRYRRRAMPFADPPAADDHPVFVKQAPALLSQAATGLPSIYWPNVIRVDDKITGALGKFYMYYSTDHDPGAGGIGMAYADHPLGPWTTHKPGGNPVIYVDTAGGVQTETPTSVWNPATNLFHLYYQIQGGPGVSFQATSVATSPDGITWTRVGVAIGNYPTGVAGGIHTGYASVFRIGHRWLAYHLATPGQYAAMGVSYSRDGLNWVTDPRQVSPQADLSGGNGRGVAWHGSQIINWRGRPWWVGHVGEGGAFGDVEGIVTHATAPLAPNHRQLAAEPIEFADLPAGETSRQQMTSIIEHEGRLYGYYRRNGGQGSVAVSIAEV